MPARRLEHVAIQLYVTSMCSNGWGICVLSLPLGKKGHMRAGVRWGVLDKNVCRGLAAIVEFNGVVGHDSIDSMWRGRAFINVNS